MARSRVHYREPKDQPPPKKRRETRKASVPIIDPASIRGPIAIEAPSPAYRENLRRQQLAGKIGAARGDKYEQPPQPSGPLPNDPDMMNKQNDGVTELDKYYNQLAGRTVFPEVLGPQPRRAADESYFDSDFEVLGVVQTSTAALCVLASDKISEKQRADAVVINVGSDGPYEVLSENSEKGPFFRIQKKDDGEDLSRFAAISPDEEALQKFDGLISQAYALVQELKNASSELSTLAQREQMGVEEAKKVQSTIVDAIEPWFAELEINFNAFLKAGVEG